MKRWIPLAVVALAFLAHHFALAFTVNLNGDELGLLERALRTLRTGEVVGGGRPGLGSLAVIPFARDCLDAVSGIVRARLAWTLFVVAGAAGLVVLLRQMIPADRRRLPAIVTALALWILAPAFLHYSVQLRTDQPAIAFGLWCGVALLASQRRSWLALVAGGLFGVGFLFSQKTAYVGALVGVLVLGRLAGERDLRPGRELLRAALLVVGAAGTALLYRLLTSVGSEAPALLSLSGNMSSREYYADMFGFRHFRWMLPTLLAQVIALGVVAIVSLDWVKKRGADGARITTAWGVVFVGAAVFLFHTTRAPYFYMVMGLFPAVAGGLVIGPMLDRLETERERWILLGALWIPLVLTAIPAGIRLLEDTQRPQREALAFVERNFPAEARGFQVYSLFMCRDNPDPFPFIGNYRAADVRFGGPEGDERARALLDEFRDRPVSFLILPSIGGALPFELWTFWWAHYVHYGHHVYVPGAGLAEGRAATRFFDVLVGGDYRWHPTDGRSPLLVDDQRLEAGGVVTLEPGEHRLELPEGGQGLFVLDLPEPPSDPPELPLFQPWPSPAADLEAEG